MFIDVVEIYYDNSRKLYYPGDTIRCRIDIDSFFPITCKYIKVRFRCPYKKDNIEYFKEYEIASKWIAKTYSDPWNGRKGEKAENITLQRGRNRFIVKFKIPKVSDEIFAKYANIIRCSCKVAVKVNWLPKRYCLDWFAIATRSAGEEAFDKIENGVSKAITNMNKKLRGLIRI